VTSEADWAEVAAFATERYGRLDVLVNNAGIVVFAPLTETSLEVFRRVVDVNQVGTFLGMKTAVPAMQSGGSIINISRSMDWSARRGCWRIVRASSPCAA